MTKTYKISYKTYYNDRLKEVDFHGKRTYPLYVQVSFGRKTIFFKSYYFELYSKPKYLAKVVGVSFTKAPSIEEIISKENKVIDFIINKNSEAFSLEIFKQEYAYYSKDLCDTMEPLFNDYLSTFFDDKGMPELAALIRDGIHSRMPYELVSDMKRALTQPLYEEMVENSFDYAPPYLPLYGFTHQRDRPHILSKTKIITAMDWEASETRAGFRDYIKATFTKIDTDQAVKVFENWLLRLRVKAYS